MKNSKRKSARNKTPPFPEWPDWSTAKFWSFVRSGLRAKWSRWPAKFAVVNKAKRKAEYEWWNAEGTRKLNVQWEYQCSQCEGWFMRTEVEVDHIEPVGSLNKYDDLPGFVERLFVGEDKLRLVCKECHRHITNSEKVK